MKKFNSHQFFRYGLFAIGGIFLGWLFFHSPNEAGNLHVHKQQTDQEGIWTCAMHPQIQLAQPGKCPLCGMDLIPLNQGNAATDPVAVHLTKEAAQLADVATSMVTRQNPVMEIRLYGKVQADERSLQSQVAHIPGRIEKLLVNFTGERVQKGQTLAILYSPELVNAQQELIEAAGIKQLQPEIYEAAKEKLRLWKLPESQIASIEQSGTIQREVAVVSNTMGIVTARRVSNGDYVSQGSVMFEIADLSNVWVLFDAYESDLTFLQQGDYIEFTVQAMPGKKYSGKIAYIDPVIDPLTRVAKVRIEAGNQSGIFKPEMFATGIVKSKLDTYKGNLVIPGSAVLWTGERSIVYVRQSSKDGFFFTMREIELGPLLGNSYIVTDGLTEGEEIVTRGTFSVDAAAQLEGKPSMMNPAMSASENMPVVSADFRLQLNKVFEKYTRLKDAFVQSDASQVLERARDFQQTLASVDTKLLSEADRDNWMLLTTRLKEQINAMTGSENIAEQRITFVTINEWFYKLLKTYNLKQRTVYYQFCPMANNGSGAYWFSESKEIRNPYYGASMLTCGETKETLSYE